MHLELGAVRLVASSEEELLTVLTGLLRHLSNKEVAAMLGVSERTVRRWKQEGRLPDRGHEQVTLAELAGHLLRPDDGTGPAASNGTPGCDALATLCKGLGCETVVTSGTLP